MDDDIEDMTEAQRAARRVRLARARVRAVGVAWARARRRGWAAEVAVIEVMRDALDELSSAIATGPRRRVKRP